MALLGEWTDKLQTGSNYLKTTYLTKDLYLKYRKNSENSTIKKIQLETGKKKNRTKNQEQTFH